MSLPSGLERPTACRVTGGHWMAPTAEPLAFLVVGSARLPSPGTGDGLSASSLRATIAFPSLAAPKPRSRLRLCFPLLLLLLLLLRRVHQHSLSTAPSPCCPHIPRDFT